ncbi:anaerobic ribonucleoside-triphosphate reductase [Cellulosilyticum lentocellum]|uniref:Anaerobic ribonucleoside-triphosphate reductase n=1 Tax=Cellulosilyticum lentocellum (strain ATCC 49066 / DSM 5427 / NCIMB 11756 / RHM5) TaxID=642492 RepID=F2JPS1_CELLD|nr:anaerobic ribonucleoside-triphosphate reductase [Cellulosilyticum lentocellum]ADZ83731.1 anaerobic ribonucleoside-triphosphate reductase [Cellulosilyticum lentocellum DSM 5427]
MKVIKRDGEAVAFDEGKIYSAIIKAMTYGSGIVDQDIARKISMEIKSLVSKLPASPTIFQIETYVYLKLIENGHELTAKAYEGYRAIQAFKRETNTTDQSILGLIEMTNEEVMNENSNKNAMMAATQRDLIAGEVSKDIARRKKLPARIVQAHDEGVLHFHDMDYFMQSIFNCCLINIKDMLDHGTVINGRMIESPKSFQVACTVMTQIIAQVASSQYGGQSVDIRHLGRYLRRSYEKYESMLQEVVSDNHERQIAVNKLLRKELESGVQTIQYQINTLMTTNGQSPFVTLFLNIEEDDEYAKEVAMIVEEILKQRLEGIKNEKGIYTTPTFPKLIYVLHEHNCLEGGKYDYVTNLAAACSAKRLYPDYISAKEMKKIYEGNVFSCMGCRSFLSPWKDEEGHYQFEGRFNQGVVSLNLPQIGIVAAGDENIFWKLLDNRLNLCFEALMCRHEALKGTLSDESPIHWQHGAIARLQKGQVIDPLLMDGYSTISLGYIGLYEATLLMTGVSHTQSEGEAFALKVMHKLREATDRWKAETGLGFGLYGSPAESLCYRFAKIDYQKFGAIKDVTDKGYYTNSYHVDVREEIDAFSKLKFESQFQPISTGGCISYIEMPPMGHNLEAIKQIIHYIYHNIQYAEFNTKSDCCHECLYEGEMIVTDALEWECPQCHNKDQSKMNVIRRTCGYLGGNYWNKGKTQEIKNRVLHL